MNHKTGLSPAKRAVAFRSLADLPFAHDFALDAEKLLEISGVARLGDLSTKNVVVVDSLRTIAHSTPESFFAIDDAAEALGTALQLAATKRHVLWLSSAPAGDVAQIESVLGGDVVHRVGLPGGDGGLAPIAVSPTALIQKWADGTPEQRALLAYLLDGADTLVMQRVNLRALRQVGANLVERHPLWRFFSNPKVMAYLVVLVYSSLRALPVAFVPGFKGNVWVLWTIDIVTAIPYTWGIVEMFAGRTIPRRMTGLVVTLVTFVSPYVYFWMHGRGYPAWVNFLVAGMIVGAFLIEYGRWLRDRIVRDVVVRSTGR